MIPGGSTEMHKGITIRESGKYVSKSKITLTAYI